MKKVTTCLICGRPVRESFGYKVRFERRYESPITGEMEKKISKGLICPICNRKVGYFGSEKKFKEYRKNFA